MRQGPNIEQPQAMLDPVGARIELVHSNSYVREMIQLGDINKPILVRTMKPLQSKPRALDVDSDQTRTTTSAQLFINSLVLSSGTSGNQRSTFRDVQYNISAPKSRSQRFMHD